MHTLEGQLRRAFTEFAHLLRSEAPFARENELVNLFVFGPLLRQVEPGAPLRDPRQIGIEVAVRQHLARDDGKAVVRKDLVIWPRPGQTAWSAGGAISESPLAILEWKGGSAKRRAAGAMRERAHDLAFLRAFTSATASAGFAAFVDRRANQWHVSVTRVVDGAAQDDWFDSDPSAGA